MEKTKKKQTEMAKWSRNNAPFLYTIKCHKIDKEYKTV